MTVPPEAALEFIRLCEERLKDRVRTVVLYGSFARGEQRPESDIDLMVLVDVADKHLLEEVSKVVASISTPNELNPAVIAESELVRNPDAFNWVQIKHEGVVLFGELPEVSPCKLSELDVAKRIAQEVLMSSRHYIAVAEPADNFASGKLLYWNLRPLAWAIRLYEYHVSGDYPQQLGALAAKYPVLTRNPATEYAAIIDECIEVCERILNG